MSRNQLPYGLRYKFSGDMTRLLGWLETNIVGRFDFELTDVHRDDASFGQIEVTFRFERAADRDRFKDTALSGRYPW